MSSHLSIINSWTSPGFRENPEQRVSSLLLSPSQQVSKDNDPLVTHHPSPITHHPVRRKP
jgi:hypothetical protein